MLLFLLGIGLAEASGALGVDWVPSGRGDLAWVASEQLTGTQVAETDGLLRPPLTAWGGWLGQRHGVLGSFDVARLAHSVRTNANAEVSTQTALRPGVDYRLYLKERSADAPQAYLQLGAYGVVPFATESSDSASKSEQTVLDQQAQQNRSRIGGVGGRVGVGAEIQLDSGVMLGARYSVVYHRSRALDEETLTVSSWLRSEAALVLGFIL